MANTTNPENKPNARKRAKQVQDVDNTKEHPLETSNVNDQLVNAPEQTVETPVVPRKFEATDLIPCRSVTPGELIAIGKKTKEVYTWSNTGDIREVEYQDLLSMKAVKSHFIFDPLFIIEDEDVIAQWKDVFDFYQKISQSDLEEILAIDVSLFESTIRNLPIGMQKALANILAEKVQDGSFDSVKKIKIADEVLGTSLMLYVD